jgi:hypothetical protein
MQRGWWRMESGRAEGDDSRGGSAPWKEGARSAKGGERGWWRMERGGRWQASAMAEPELWTPTIGT